MMQKSSKDFLNLIGNKEIRKLLDQKEIITFSSKVLKFNPWLWKQERILLITNVNLYNIKKIKIQRKIPISSIYGLTKSTFQDIHEFVVHVFKEHDYRFISPLKEDIIEVIKIINPNIKIFQVPHNTLKIFTTTEEDVKLGVSKEPPKEFEFKPEIKDYEQEIFEKHKNNSSTIYEKNKTSKEVKLSNFKIIKKLGKGSYGTVFLVENICDNKIYALKQLRKDLLINEGQIQYTIVEKQILENSNHPFLCHLEFVFQTPTNVYFGMKYYSGGDLYKLLMNKTGFPEEVTRLYSMQVGLGIGHLHKKNIIYRDLKPENVMIDEMGYLSLADFGLAKVLEKDEVAKTFCGTPDYIAPEIIKQNGYNRMADWWAFGILLYEMSYSCAPFAHSNQNIVFNNIIKGEIKFPDSKNKSIISQSLKDLICKLLVTNPDQRFGFKGDIDEIISHPFYKEINKEKLLKKEYPMQYKPEEKIIPKNIMPIKIESNPDEQEMKLIAKHEDEFSKIN